MRTSLIICLINTTYQLSLKPAVQQQQQKSKSSGFWEWLRNPFDSSDTNLNVDSLKYGPLTKWETSFAGGSMAKSIKDKHIYCATRDEGDHISIKAWIHSELEDKIPTIIHDAFFACCWNDEMVHISRFSVKRDWQKIGLADKMLALALEDIRREWPNAVGVYFQKGDIEFDDIQPFTNNNFTVIPKSNNRGGDEVYLYKFPLKVEDLEYKRKLTKRSGRDALLLSAMIKGSEGIDTMIGLDTRYEDPHDDKMEVACMEEAHDVVLQTIRITFVKIDYIWLQVPEVISTLFTEALKDVKLGGNTAAAPQLLKSWKCIFNQIPKHWPNAISAVLSIQAGHPAYQYFVASLKESGFRRIAEGPDGKFGEPVVAKRLTPTSINLVRVPEVLDTHLAEV